MNFVMDSARLSVSFQVHLRWTFLYRIYFSSPIINRKTLFNRL